MSANKPDDLLSKAKKLRDRSDNAQKSNKEQRESSAFHEASRHISDMHKTYTQVTGTIGWLYTNIISPVINHPWIGKPFQWYRALWERIVYTKENQFSKRRAGILVLATIAFVWTVPSLLNGTVEFIWDTGRMAVSYKKDEIWYLGKSQEIDAAGNIFSAQGCESVQCSDQTSIYFRIKPSLAHHIWSFYHNGNVFFPDYVAAGIQNDINKCEVTGYGVRWKFLVRNWDVYPQILSVNCTPLTEKDIKGALQQ